MPSHHLCWLLPSSAAATAAAPRPWEKWRPKMNLRTLRRLRTLPKMERDGHFYALLQQSPKNPGWPWMIWRLVRWPCGAMWGCCLWHGNVVTSIYWSVVVISSQLIYFHPCHSSSFVVIFPGKMFAVMHMFKNGLNLWTTASCVHWLFLGVCCYSDWNWLRLHHYLYSVFKSLRDSQCSHCEPKEHAVSFAGWLLCAGPMAAPSDDCFWQPSKIQLYPISKSA